MLHSSGAAHLFLDREDVSGNADCLGNSWVNDESKFLPLYEGKMFSSYDHRFAGVVITDNLSRPAQPLETTVEERLDPNWLPTPRCWVDSAEIPNHCPDDTRTSWFLGFKDVGSATNERTLITTIIPEAAIVDSVNLLRTLN